MASNQAAWLDKAGQTLRVGEAEAPAADANEVTIRNHALAINPIDWKQQDSGFMIKTFPTILGCDVAGEIVKVGSSVSNFKVGDRVIGHAIALATGLHKHAGFQKYTTLPTSRVAKIPDSLNYNDAVVLPIAISTAADGLYSTEEGFLGLPYPTTDIKPSGKTIVVYGASSSVGAATVQLAKFSGVQVVALASEKNFDLVKSAGAAVVIDYKDSQAVEKVVQAVQELDGEFAGVYDAISLEGQSYHITVPVIERLGTGVLTTVLPGPKSLPSTIKTGNVFAPRSTTDPVWQDFLEPALAAGSLKALPPPVVIATGLEGIQAGLAENKRGVSGVKVVVAL